MVDSRQQELKAPEAPDRARSAPKPPTADSRLLALEHAVEFLLSLAADRDIPDADRAHLLAAQAMVTRAPTRRGA